MLFYLQGSIKEAPESDGSPVVSRGDYLHTVQIRQASMDTFRNVIVSGGTVIYLGYSFGDQFLDDLLDEAARRIGNRNMPYGYAILPEWPGNRTGAAAKISRKFITPVEGSFEQFAELIDQAVTAQQTPRATSPTAVRAAPAAGRVLSLATGSVKLSERDAAVQSEYFELLYDELIRDVPLDEDDETRMARAFLKGESLGWLPFVREWAFKRSAYPDVLAAIRDATDREQHGHERLVLVHGPAGLGKSVMARQLALDLYRENGFLVLLGKPVWRARPDLAAFQRVLDDVEEALPEAAELPPIVLIVDEAELLEHTVARRVVKQGQLSGRTVVVVLVARTNEYFRLDAGNNGTREKWGYPVQVPLQEAISEGEVRSLIRHIKRLHLWSANRLTDEAFWVSHVSENLGSSFFDAIYSLVEDSQTPLRERVWSEYQRLGETARAAYLLIAATHQFGLPLKMEMLVRALAVSFADFDAQVIRSDARDVLFGDYDTNELNIFYRGRTRMISSLVFERALPDTASQLVEFRRIVGSATGSSMFGSEEIDLVRNLLVRVLGPGGFDRRFSPDQQAELFAIATEAIEDDVLEHHFGLIERDAGRLESARHHLERALSLSASIDIPRESLQNIENSLAQVLGDLAITALERGDSDQGDALFEEASRQFVSARSGEFANAAAYDAHARLVIRRAKVKAAGGTAERAIAVSEALDILSTGIDNVSEEMRGELHELRVSTLASLGFVDTAVDELERIALTLPDRSRARYELMIARSISAWGSKERGKALRRALPHAVAATEFDPNYFEAWRLRAEIFQKLHPADFTEMKDLLEKAAAVPGGQDNNWVLYELAVSYFYLERYEQSAQLFNRLRRVSRGVPAGSGPQERAGERTGADAFEFEGRVMSRSDGAPAIECQELTAFGPIWFQPRRQRQYKTHLHDRVSFVIGFSNKGVQALELRKL